MELDPLKDAPRPFIDKAMRFEPGGEHAFHREYSFPAQAVRRGSQGLGRMGSPDHLHLIASFSQEGEWINHDLPVPCHQVAINASSGGICREGTPPLPHPPGNHGNAAAWFDQTKFPAWPARRLSTGNLFPAGLPLSPPGHLPPSQREGSLSGRLLLSGSINIPCGFIPPLQWPGGCKPASGV